MPQNKYTADLYLRLSRDEEAKQESYSITNQRRMLTTYAEENGFKIGAEFIDDGISGTTFDRKGFQDMMDHLEAGKANMVIVKDLSRLGRDYLETGIYMEKVFPDMDIRLIAIGDNYDSDMEDTYKDMSVFINYFNEFHAKQTSRKTRDSKKSLAKAGKFIGSKAPYGYQRDPDNRHHLLIDEDAAPVVKDIFQWACDGYGFKSICRLLRDRGTPNPSAYANLKNPGTYKSEYWQQPHDWHATSIKTILNNPVYLGNLVSGRRRVKSFKCKDIIHVPESEHIVVKDTHQAIIDQHTWNLAHEKLQTRKRCDNHGAVQIFAGLVKCADCGYAMAFTQSDGHKRYQCSTYNVKGKNYCTSHHITYEELYSAVLHDIRRRAKAAVSMDEHLLRRLRQEASGKLREKVNALQKESARLEQRVTELDTIISKLFEAHVLGRVSESRYDTMLEQYEMEQAESRERLVEINSELAERKAQANESEQFLKLIAKYQDIQQLTAPVLNELIRKIEIGPIRHEEGIKRRSIRIEYRQFCFVELFTQDQVFAGWSDEMLDELKQTDQQFAENKDSIAV